MTNWCGQYSIPRVEGYWATGLQWELFEGNLSRSPQKSVVIVCNGTLLMPHLQNPGLIPWGWRFLLSTEPVRIERGKRVLLRAIPLGGLRACFNALYWFLGVSDVVSTFYETPFLSTFQAFCPVLRITIWLLCWEPFVKPNWDALTLGLITRKNLSLTFFPIFLSVYPLGKWPCNQNFMSASQ